MDVTKALDELKRTREYLEAVTVSEQTLKQVGSIGEEITRLEKRKAELYDGVARLTDQYSSASKSHGIAMGKLSSERTAAQDDLDAVKREIAASKKAFDAEVRSYSDQIREAKKVHAEAASAMSKEIEASEAKLRGVQETIKNYLKG